MNIHEHQAKEILKEYGAPVSNGVVIYSLDEVKQKIKKLKSKNTNLLLYSSSRVGLESWE